MKTLKKIEKILSRPANYNMVGDGFRVYNYFPGGYNIGEKFSPFLMLDFNPAFDFGPSPEPKGVGVHPHKGFETVTIAYKGSVAHHDSTGNSGIIRPGDVQWMTAGNGILHKEYHEESFSKNGGLFEMVQLWVNLPKKDKGTPAHYQSLSASQMGKVNLDNNGGTVNVIAGDYNGTKGAATTFTNINVFDMRLNNGAETSLEIPASHNTGILIVEGGAEINGEAAAQHSFVFFKNEGETITVKAFENSVLLVLSGEPIPEPIAQYGPFVMNTMSEIHEAIGEFNSGKFGRLD